MRNAMRRTSLLSPLVLLIAGATSALAAGSEADYKAAYAAAEAANKEAGGLAQSMDHDGGDAGGGEESRRWPATSTRRRRRPKEAEALAKASIFQATSEKERWKDMEIR